MMRLTQRGAALILAMVLLAFVATLAYGMVWQQWHSLEMEASWRARTKVAWILNGALDWARVVLREDARQSDPAGTVTSLHARWARPLSDLGLGAVQWDGGDRSAGDIRLEPIAGVITDGQAKYNLRNLSADGVITANEIALLERLCSAGGLSATVAQRLGAGLIAAQLRASAGAPLQPTRIDDLLWLGLTAAEVDQLRPLATILPVPTKLNINTATAPVLAAVIKGVNLDLADTIVRTRLHQPFDNLDSARAALPGLEEVSDLELTTSSDFFEIRWRMRLEERLFEEVALLQRRGLEVNVVHRSGVRGVPTP